jgi:hypothetical protein
MSSDEVISVPLIDVDASVAGDRRSLMLRLGEPSSPLLMVAINTHSVDALINALGNARSQMLEPVPPDVAGTYPITAYDPRWIVNADIQNKFATFWIRHPGLGWSIYAFSRHEASNISKWLRKVISVTSTRETQSPAATSFGGDTFLMTTEGLGFYYYGKGEKRIGPNPFEQVEFDSDRAAGIVAGSIVETRLEQAIKSQLRSDKPDISGNLFQPSGALGPFRTKIDLSYMMGIISDDAHKDLTVIKNIRNDFAHKLDYDTFDHPSIRDRCKNLILVDKHVGPPPSIGSIIATPSVTSYLGLPDYEQKLKDPRFRYTFTAQHISNRLGEGSDNDTEATPFV